MGFMGDSWLQFDQKIFFFEKKLPSNKKYLEYF
jgi:hypothetical protein